MGNKEDSGNKKSSLLFFVIFFSVIILGVSAYALFFYDKSPQEINTAVLNKEDSLKKEASEEKYQEEFLKAASSEGDTNVTIIHVSESQDMNANYVIDTEAGKSIKRVFTGRRINIALTGLDNRLGTRSNHADANHVMSILLDSGQIEIISVPRDTPADAGMPDTSGQNKLTIVRAVKGRQAYHKELARIAGLDKIHYFAEVSFSQVMGLIEFLGMKDAKSTLQVLRSRTGLGGDDYQRCYNQGQFIRQMFLKHFNKASGLMGEVLVRGGLAIVEGNLSASVLNNIIEQLHSKNFPRSPESVTIRVRPPIGGRYKVYDLTSDATIRNLTGKIERFNTSRGMDTIKVTRNVKKLLWSAIQRSIPDTAKRPNNVIKNLSTYFEQHAWLQVENHRERDSLREQFCNLLRNAYIKKKQYDKAARVQEVLDAERALFQKTLKDN